MFKPGDKIKNKETKEIFKVSNIYVSHGIVWATFEEIFGRYTMNNLVRNFELCD